jgi:gliding motility-associated-like protein
MYISKYHSFTPLIIIGVFIYIILFPSSLKSAILNDSLECNGTLGENIFTDGDFGSGTLNIPPVNPNIAPGYTYTTNPPPSDGFYTITNNTGQWANLYGTWLEVTDNSNDPNGYFMVVNASFEPGLFYSQEVPDLCPNTQYEFSIDIINMIQRGVGGHIPPNIDMLLNGDVILSTGDIPQNQEWTTFSVSFCTGPLDSVMTLSIRNNAPGGTGNDLGLDNISFRACGPLATISPEEPIFVCLDDNIEPVFLTAEIPDPTFNAIQWQTSSDSGATWQDIGTNNPTVSVTNFSSGIYLYRYMLATSPDNLRNTKCRVFSEVKLIVTVPIFYEFADTICDGGSLTVGNSTYTQSGTYIDSLVSSIGCDSIVTTNLTVVPQPATIPIYDASNPTCFGDADGSIVVTDVPGATPPLSYYLDTITNNNPGVFIQVSAGDYGLRVTDRYGCVFTDSISLTDPALYEIRTIEDTSVIFGEGLQLRTLVNDVTDTYQWRADSGLSCRDCASPFAVPPGTTTYQVEATSELGCMARDSVTISVDRNDFPIYIPSGFTPNGDGVNDLFTIVAKSPGGIRRVARFAVFNRWGNLVYDYQGGVLANGVVEWNGRGRRNAVPEGVYAFILKLKLELIDNSVKYFGGSITVVR